MTKYIRKYRITITTDNGTVHNEESKNTWFVLTERDTFNKSGVVLDTLQEGQSASVGVNVKVECLVNRLKPRCPRRPHEVIVQEKEARRLRVAAQAQERAQWEERWKADQEMREKSKRKRITAQIDHAFLSGKHSGSGPVEKFLTCSNCDSPAAVLLLSRPIPAGATVLDESTILDAFCSEHERFGTGDKVPCADLEFLYEGIRQVAIKARL
jgi:hypothetical protein